MCDRVNCALIPDAAQALARLSERTGYKQVDIVNRALQIYDFIEGETRMGNDFLLRSQGKPDQKVKFRWFSGG